MRRTARLAILYVLEALAALLALAIFAVAALLWRLAEGPVDAELLRDRATAGLLEAVGGDVASIGSIQVSFDPGLGALVITARQVIAARTGGEIIIDASRVETALALDLILTGRAAPVRIAVDGGAFSIVRTADGQVYAGLGGPEAETRAPGRGATIRSAAVLARSPQACRRKPVCCHASPRLICAALIFRSSTR
jgi:hypothetical protein